MRHNKAGRLFGRTANQRKALLRGLVGSLIEHERIETTIAKAKETRRIAEKLVTLGIRGDLHAKRLVMAKIPNRALVIKLFDSIAPRFSGRNGGYLRIVRTRQRVNDRAQMAVLEFIDYEDIRESGKGDKKETEAKETKPKAVKSKETEAKEAKPKAAKSKETEAKEAKPKAAKSKEKEAKEAKPKAVKPKETEAKEAKSKGVKPKETEAKEAKSKGAKGGEEG